jgi:hypothetical protein
MFEGVCTIQSSPSGGLRLALKHQAQSAKPLWGWIFSPFGLGSFSVGLQPGAQRSYAKGFMHTPHIFRRRDETAKL